ncbi:MAG: HemK/PrmC family methyltransferase, partial [Nitrospirota bacterium]
MSAPSPAAPSMWTVGEALRRAAALLASAGVEEPRLEAELLLLACASTDKPLTQASDEGGHRMAQLACASTDKPLTRASDGGSRLDLYRDPDYALAPSIISRFDETVRRRAAGEPLQYVRGWEEFAGFRLDVGPGVLVPRPETEWLAERAVTHLRAVAGTRSGPPWFLELGTGSGGVAIALAGAVERAIGVAIDCSADALAVARRNVARHGLAGRIQLMRGDLCAALKHTDRFDLIVANLPYVPTSDIAGLQAQVRDWEPRLALDGGPDGLRLIGRLLRTAGPLLSAGGRLMLEIGA